MNQSFRVVLRRLGLPDQVQVRFKSEVVHPNGYISQDIYECARSLGLDEEDATYVVTLYNDDLLFWGTGYYAEMRRIPWETWTNLRAQFEVNE